MDTNDPNAILGLVAEVLPRGLTVEQLHRFTNAPIGACLRLLLAVREQQANEELEFEEGIQDQLLLDRIQRIGPQVDPTKTV